MTVNKKTLSEPKRYNSFKNLLSFESASWQQQIKMFEEDNES